MGLLTHFLLAALRFLEFLLVLRCLFSWIPNMRSSRIVDFIYFFTDPLVQPFQALLHNIDFLRTMPIDFSPLFAFAILQVLQNLLY